MGVLGELFGFDGRINRLGYLWRALLGGLVIGVGGALTLFALYFVLRPQSLTGIDVWTQWVITGAVLLGLWNGFALACRRLRDMGLEPAYILPAYAALWVANEVLLAPMSVMQPQAFGALEDGWRVLSCATLLPLLFWPSAPVAAPARPHYEPVEPTRYLNWRESGS
jgi:uncharacterized membrane protein YhaH (DUF805 family)